MGTRGSTMAKVKVPVHEAKITWMVQRTGCSPEEAKRWLVPVKYKIEVAIQNRRFHLEAEAQRSLL